MILYLIITTNNKTSREREREQLQQDINNLTNKPNKTPQEQQDLANKKKQLEELEKNPNLSANTNTKEPANWQPWVIGGGIVLVIALAVYYYRKKYNKR